MSAADLARAITHADLDLARALRYEPRNIALHEQLEARLNELLREQLRRLPVNRIAA